MRVTIPDRDELAAAPELAAVTVALIAALAARRALEAAHPVLLFLDGATEPALDDAEHAAACAVGDAQALVDALALYTDALRRRAERERTDDHDLF
jgi:hypothetical protein